MTQATVKAGINVYAETNRLNGNFDQIKMALVPDEALPPLNPALKQTIGITARQSRMLQLADPALKEVLANHKDKEPVTLYLAGPEPIPNTPLPIRSVFIKQLQQQTGLAIDVESSKVFPMGRAGAFYALEYAFEYLETSGKKYIVVGGVDSYWDPLTLGILARDKRVQTIPGEMDAFVPGEGAGFLLLSVDEPFQGARKLYRPGIAEEEGGRYSDKPYRGDGLSQAFRKAIENGTGAPISNIYSSLNGESFGNKEFGVAVMRSSDSLNPEYDHRHPAECFGDLGGAFGTVLIGLAALNDRNYSLCYGSSEHEFRGAACVA